MINTFFLFIKHSKLPFFIFLALLGLLVFVVNYKRYTEAKKHKNKDDLKWAQLGMGRGIAAIIVGVIFLLLLLTQ